MEERAYADIEPEPESGGDPFDAPLPRRGVRRPWWRRTQVLAAGGVVAVAAAVAVGVLIGRGSNAAPAAAPTASTSAAPDISFSGEISLGPFDAIDGVSGNTISLSDGDTCTAIAGFSDIAQGAAVDIGGSTGQTIAIASLGPGVLRANANGALVCQFAFQALIPGGQSLYTVTISHRGTQTFTPAQVAQGISLTLGG